MSTTFNASLLDGCCLHCTWYVSLRSNDATRNQVHHRQEQERVVGSKVLVAGVKARPGARHSRANCLMYFSRTVISGTLFIAVSGHGAPCPYVLALLPTT